MKQDFKNLSNLAERQKSQQAIKTKIRNFKQTHDIKLAKSLSLIT